MISSVLSIVITIVVFANAFGCALLCINLQEDSWGGERAAYRGSLLLALIVLGGSAVLLSIFAVWLFYYEPYLLICRLSNGACTIGAYGWSVALLCASVALLLFKTLYLYLVRCRK